MVAGIIIWINPEWSIADPICTFVFSVLVLFTTFKMLMDAVNVLMAGTPEGIDALEVKKEIVCCKTFDHRGWRQWCSGAVCDSAAV